MTDRRNLYIVTEGLGGSGKGTVIMGLKKHFEEIGYRVVLTFEPGGTPRANVLRAELFEKKKNGLITPWEELEYVFEARALNMQEVVLPALTSEQLTVVLKDRDYFSSFMYQVASGASRELLLEYYRKEYDCRGFPRPDMRLLLLLDLKEAWRRRHSAGFDGDGFDMQPDEYWKKVDLLYESEAMEVAAGRGLFRRETVIVEAGHSKDWICRDAWLAVVRQFGLADPELLTEGYLQYGRYQMGRLRGWAK